MQGLLNIFEDFLDARRDDFSELAPFHPGGLQTAIITQARGLNPFCQARAFEIGGAIDTFEALGGGECRADALRDIGGHMCATSRDKAKPCGRAVQID